MSLTPAAGRRAFRSSTRTGERFACRFKWPEQTTVQAPPTAPLTVTEKAASKVKQIIAEQQPANGAAPEKLYLRLRVVGGGCSGFQNKLDLDPQVNEKLDEVYDFHGIQVVVDKRSLMYLEGGGRGLPRRAAPPGLQHHQPAGQEHLRLRQLVFDVSALPARSASEGILPSLALWAGRDISQPREGRTTWPSGSSGRRASCCSGIWVIIQGLSALGQIAGPSGAVPPWAAAILAVVAGVLLILDM